jgi:hypothetical protein
MLSSTSTRLVVFSYVTHKDGWTAIAFWDRSLDKRPGSSSAFILEGTHSFEDMLETAREKFADIFARLTFEITKGRSCE